MKNNWIEKHLRRKADVLAAMTSTEGFTLTELLVVVIISSIIVSALLGLVVQLVGTEQRESVRTETQREMQLALNYIASDLRQAVYIYEGTPHPEEPASVPSYIDFLPNALQGANYRPVLAFWKTSAVPNLEGTGLPDFNPNNIGGGCLDFGLLANGNPGPLANECNNLWLKRQNYSLVAYFQVVNDAADKWKGKSRIARYELDKYSNVAALERNDGYVDPAEIGSSGFTTWPYGPADATGGGIVDCQEQTCAGTQGNAGTPNGGAQVLIDYVDFIDNATPPDQVALRAQEPDDCGVLNIPGDSVIDGDSVTPDTPDPGDDFVNYYMIPKPDAANPKPAFFVCLKNTRDPAQPGNPRVGQIQDTVVFLRGNANGRGGTGTDSFLPTLQTRVTMRGVIDRVIR